MRVRAGRRVVVTVLLLVGLLGTAAVPAWAEATLRQGDRGPAVSEWQGQLNQVQDPDVAVDGIFGPATDRATRAFQQSAGLTVDGIVGPRTRTAMQAALRGGGTTPPPPPPSSSPGGGTVKPGSSGPQVRALQEQLVAQHYWLGTADGVYGDLTRQAVMAFQKVNGLARDGIAGPRTQAALASPRAPQPRSGSGTVMEVDEAHQVLLRVSNGQVQEIFNSSTGTEGPYTYNGRQYLADTPNGQWQVTREIDGWRTSRLGQLYRPKYFHPDGIAIHGSNSVPAYAASHGCVRVSIPAMDHLWTRVPIGTAVWVY
jgi:peptidoglycan hydrolase-like protein with peptidoglycan-binding domain